jgi:hypothetical protein
MRIDLDELRARSIDPKKIERLCGIYFLFFIKDLVYIGQSRDIFARIRSHMKEGQKQFTRFAYIECLQVDLDSVERDLILTYKPRYNKVFSRPMVGPPRPSHLPRPCYLDRSRFSTWADYIDECWRTRIQPGTNVVIPGEASLILGISADRLRNMALRRQIPALLIGNRYRFTKDDLLAATVELRLPFALETQNASL